MFGLHTIGCPIGQRQLLDIFVANAQLLPQKMLQRTLSRRARTICQPGTMRSVSVTFTIKTKG
jgi:hypothetical protein